MNNYDRLEQLLTPARLKRYFVATGSNKNKTGENCHLYDRLLAIINQQKTHLRNITSAVGINTSIISKDHHFVKQISRNITKNH